MTCVVALRTENNKVILGADCYASDSECGVKRIEPKVFKKGRVAFGYSGSFRFGQIVRYAFEPPKIRKKESDLMSYMVTKFVPDLRKTLEQNSFPMMEEEMLSWRLIVAIDDEIFYIEPDWQVGHDFEEYTAIGSGARYAFGSLYSTKYLIEDPYDRVYTALGAAENYSPTVSGPFYLLET